MASQALIQNDAVVVGILALCLGFVFYTSNSPHPFWRGFYRYIPALLICISARGPVIADDGVAPLNERIDRLVDAARPGPSAELCTDAEFLRRVYLDLLGTIPSVAECRQFLDDSSASQPAEDRPRVRRFSCNCRAGPPRGPVGPAHLESGSLVGSSRRTGSGYRTDGLALLCESGPDPPAGVDSQVTG